MKQFVYHLKLDFNKLPYKNGFDESFITFLPEDDLRVFTDEIKNGLKKTFIIVNLLIILLKLKYLLT